MLTQLVIVHRKKPEIFAQVPAGWRIFVTCLRSLAISFSHEHLPELLSTDQVFRGPEAYRFLLEVTCGLQSPIVGETEVFGQFRRFAEEWSEPSPFFQSLYADVKAIRQEHLSHLGSLSYGSWVRKQVVDGETIHIAGTGQLAQEISVWLRKQNSVRLYSRATELARERLRQTPLAENLDVRELSVPAILSNEVVVIAAPISSSAIEKWMGDETPRLFIDLRDDSSIDKVITSGQCYRLQDIFAEIEAGRAQANEKVKMARQMIDAAVSKRFQSQVVRPFGWDDLCA